MINCKICTQEFMPCAKKGLTEINYTHCDECRDCDRQKILDNFKELITILKPIKEMQGE